MHRILGNLKITAII